MGHRCQAFTNNFMVTNGDEEHGFRIVHQKTSQAEALECPDQLDLDTIIEVLSSYAAGDERWSTLVRWELCKDNPLPERSFVQEPRFKPATYLYIFRECGLPFYKVGVASDPAARLHQLQTGNSTSIEVVGAWPFETREAAKLVESRIHYRHRVARRAGGTEWFHLDDDEIEWLKRDLQANAWQEATARDQSYRDIQDLLPWLAGAVAVVWEIGKAVFRIFKSRRKA